MNLDAARTRSYPRGDYEEYHPYGSTAWWAGSSATVPQKRYRFTGMERDDETGLQCHGVRYYAVWLGRWVSADPIGLGGGVNRFGYCQGSPLGGFDPSGMGMVAVIAQVLAGCSSPAVSPPPSPTELKARFVKGTLDAMRTITSEASKEGGAFRFAAGKSDTQLPATGWRRQGETTKSRGHEGMFLARSEPELTATKSLAIAFGGGSSVDCGMASQLGAAQGLRAALGDSSFNAWAKSKKHPIEIGVVTLHPPQAEDFMNPVALDGKDPVSSLQVGDLVYFRGAEGYNAKLGPWQGENAVVSGVNQKGEKLYLGIGFEQEVTE